MIRDQNRNETELRETRQVLDAFDSAMRRFAAGNIGATMDIPFPIRFEGLRRDFNRGTATVGRSVDAVIESASALRSDSDALRNRIADSTLKNALKADEVGKLGTISGHAERTAQQHAAALRHTSTITHNARLDMRRAQQAALSAKNDEVGRELAAINIYLEAIAEQLDKLSTEADQQVITACKMKEQIAALRTMNSDAGSDMIATITVLDSMDRNLGNIGREAARFVQVKQQTPEPPRDPVDPKPFLRLVKG